MRHPNKRAWRAGLLAALLAASGAWAQGTAPAPDCPKAIDVDHPRLLGLWRAEFEGEPLGATVLLEKHPEFAGSFSGGVNRSGERSRIAADIEDGDFTMEESRDGEKIWATWLGEVVEGSCGKEIRGTWQAEGDKRAKAFVMRKL